MTISPRPVRAAAMATLAVLASASIAAPANAQERTCSQLAGENRVASSEVKVVLTDEVLRGCTLPDGPVHLLRRRVDGITVNNFTFGQAAGRFFVLNTDAVDNCDGCGSSQFTDVIDLANGRSRSLSTRCGGPQQMVLGADGRAVAQFYCVTRYLVGLRPNGGRIVLDTFRRADDFVSGSLTLEGRTAGWTKRGVAKRGRI